MTSKRKPEVGKPRAGMPEAGKQSVRRSAAADRPAARKTTEASAAKPAATERFPVIGIGASAGGLAAIEEFLSALPADRDLGMALVLIQHLDPNHESLLLDLVKRFTSIDVSWAEDGMEVRPGCAYILPPNKEMTLAGGVLHVAEREPSRGLRLPIDYFFRSLADDLGERAAASCSRAPGVTARSACVRSRAQAAWPSRRTPRRPPTTACRAASSPRAWPTTRWPRPRCRSSCSTT